MVNRRLVRAKTLQVLYGYHLTDGASLPEAERALHSSLRRYHDLQHLLLALLLALQDENARRIAQAQTKFLQTEEDRHPTSRFVDHRVLGQLRANRPLASYLRDHHLGWESTPHEVRALYDALQAAPFHREYLQATLDSWGHDHHHLHRLLDWLEGREELPTFLEAIHIHWSTDFSVAIGSLRQLVDQLEETPHPEAELLPQAPDAGSLDFASQLLVRSVQHFDTHVEYIRQALHRWDVERVAGVDLLLLVMAVSEALYFEEIPRRVTLDEYIELARIFSTEGSPSFINGVLDQVFQQLDAQGLITKQGRGLQE